MTKLKLGSLFACIVLCLLAGAIGSYFTTPSIGNWYTNLNKPFFNPPSWVFAPVWTILYIVMGLALYLIWTHQHKQRTRALAIFVFQLALNVLWSVFFFGLKSPWLAFGEILVLWLAIYFTIRKFAHIYKPAGRLLLPYLAWVTFATLLNLAVALLN